MTEIRFHRDLYPGEKVDEALKLFEGFGAFERVEDPSYWVVRVDAGAADDERRVLGELQNYVLGLTVKGRSR
jgi:hypothetical protein